MEWTIYKVTNKINGKKYIGITKNRLGARFNEHCSKKYSVLNLAIQKHGRENFFIEAIDSAESLTEALEKETYFIKEENTSVRNRLGYNVEENTVGGEHTEDTLARIVNTKRERKKNDSFGSIHKTSFIGVYFIQERGRWAWSFNVNGKKISSKNFTTDESAALDRDISLVDYFSKKICLQTMNFPEKYEDIAAGRVNRPNKELKISLKKSSYNFVAYEKRQDQWRARVNQKGKSVRSIAGFATELEAAEVADYLNLQTIKDESLLNFPEKREYYLSCKFQMPKTHLHKKRRVPYQNISCENRLDWVSYRVSLYQNKVRIRESFDNLGDAIKRRDELRESYGLPKALDFPD
jgi:group I intron endonuclease